MDRRLVGNMVKDWALALVVVVAVMLAWTALSPRPASSGPAPGFTLSDVDGKAVSLGDLKGQVVVVNFWATWCGPCRAEIPELATFHASHPDVPMYGISIDNDVPDARLGAIGKKLGITYTILHDGSGSAANAYGVEGVPMTFIVDRQGQIGRVIQGATDKSSLERAFSAVDKS